MILAGVTILLYFLNKLVNWWPASMVWDILGVFKGSKTTFKFYNEVFNASNLLGIFTGHIHKNSIEIINGKPQIVSDDNASGGYLDIDFLNLKERIL